MSATAICLQFPGQSSWRTGMLREAAALGPQSLRLLSAASEVLGRDLLLADASAARPNNREIQVGVFLASLMHLAALEQTGLSAVASLGLSLGEYAHLVHIGALEFEAALRLVDARGRLYDEGPRGKMAAVFPLALEELSATLRDVAGVEIVNLNSPTQNVIAGVPDAVERALQVLDEETFAQAVVIEERIAMHSSGFASVAGPFAPYLTEAPWQAPRLAYRPNVDATVVAAPAPADFQQRLSRHVHQPVLWRRSIERCVAEFPELVFIEVGPGRVLSNLLSRKWLPNRKFATDEGGNPRAAIAQLATELGDG